TDRDPVAVGTEAGIQKAADGHPEGEQLLARPQVPRLDLAVEGWRPEIKQGLLVRAVPGGQQLRAVAVERHAGCSLGMSMRRDTERFAARKWPDPKSPLLTADGQALAISTEGNRARRVSAEAPGQLAGGCVPDGGGAPNHGPGDEPAVGAKGDRPAGAALQRAD